MLTAKTGDWFVNNPQRGRSNNSAILIRDELTREEWSRIMKSVKDFGEPGFIFSDSTEFLFNPCVTGDTLLTCKDHGLISEGQLESNGVEYQIPMAEYVKLFETTALPPMVLSYNIETGEKEWAPVTAAALTRKNADIIELELENGKSIKLTPDHKIYTENRGWIEAKDLNETDVLITA